MERPRKPSHDIGYRYAYFVLTTQSLEVLSRTLVDFLAPERLPRSRRPLQAEHRFRDIVPVELKSESDASTTNPRPTLVTSQDIQGSRRVDRGDCEEARR